MVLFQVSRSDPGRQEPEGGDVEGPPAFVPPGADQQEQQRRQLHHRGRRAGGSQVPGGIKE